MGGSAVSDPTKLIEDAVKLAKEADVVIAVVGINADWETEGYDRTTLSMPGRTDELVEKVAAANSNTVVVTQAVRMSFPFLVHLLMTRAGLRRHDALGIERQVHLAYLVSG